MTYRAVHVLQRRRHVAGAWSSSDETEVGPCVEAREQRSKGASKAEKERGQVSDDLCETWRPALATSPQQKADEVAPIKRQATMPQDQAKDSVQRRPGLKD